MSFASPITGDDTLRGELLEFVAMCSLVRVELKNFCPFNV